MATPNLDYLHVRLANSINDTKASTASTAGDLLSVAQRTDYLNRAKLVFIQEICGATKNKRILRTLLQSVVKTQQFQSVTAGVAVNSNYINIPLSLTSVDAPTETYHFHPNKEDLDNTYNFDLTYSYTISGGNIYVYKNGAIVNSADPPGITYIFYYISGDHCDSAGTAISQGGSTDISLASMYWDEVVKRAAELYYREVGDLQSVQVNK